MFSIPPQGRDLGQTTLESISFGSRYQPEMEAAEVMSLLEGNLIVFSGGLRHIAQDSRKAVLGWLTSMPLAPEARLSTVTEASPVRTGKAAGERFW